MSTMRMNCFTLFDSSVVYQFRNYENIQYAVEVPLQNEYTNKIEARMWSSKNLQSSLFCLMTINFI